MDAIASPAPRCPRVHPDGATEACVVETAELRTKDAGTGGSYNGDIPTQTPTPGRALRGGLSTRRHSGLHPQGWRARPRTGHSRLRKSVPPVRHHGNR